MGTLIPFLASISFRRKHRIHRCPGFLQKKHCPCGVWRSSRVIAETWRMVNKSRSSNLPSSAVSAVSRACRTQSVDSSGMVVNNICRSGVGLIVLVTFRTIAAVMASTCVVRLGSSNSLSDSGLLVRTLASMARTPTRRVRSGRSDTMVGVAPLFSTRMTAASTA